MENSEEINSNNDFDSKNSNNLLEFLQIVGKLKVSIIFIS